MDSLIGVPVPLPPQPLPQPHADPEPEPLPQHQQHVNDRPRRNNRPVIKPDYIPDSDDSLALNLTADPM